MMDSPPTSPLVFISYSPEDEIWKNLLVRHLRVLEQEGALHIWEDCRMPAGVQDDWGPYIETMMASARVAVLLISADFLNSGFMHGRDVPELLRRRETAGLRVIPVIVRPCPWQAVPWLAKIQCWPNGVMELATMPKADAEKHLSSLALEIRDLLTEPVEAPPPLPPPVHVAPQVPPPIPQPPPAPRRSRAGLLLGIGTIMVLVILFLASLDRWSPKPTGEAPATGAPPPATTLTAEAPATDPPPSDTATTAAEISSTDAPPPSDMTTAAAETEPAPAGPGSQFLDVWVEPNVQRWGRRGVLIHSRLIIFGSRHDRCRLIAYFHDASEESPEGAETDEGELTVAESFTPRDDPAKFEDLTLFMPYAKLKLAPGINRLRFLLQVQRRPSGEVVAMSSDFSLTLQR